MKVTTPTSTPDAAHVAFRSIPWSAAITVGLGVALPIGAHAFAIIIPPACVPGQALTAGSCSLDVNGGGADILVNVGTGFGSLGALSSSLTFLTTNFKYLTRLVAGDVVDAAAFSAGSGFPSGIAYDNLPNDGWASVGATGFAGFRIFDGDGGYNYGYVELTRGSLTVGSTGYQTILNTGITIPGAPGGNAVPEPSSLALVAAGAAGMVALRRRRIAAAALVTH